MSVQSKFFKLNPDILVEYIYNNENAYAESYNVITDLNTTEKLYIPNSTSTKSKLATNLLLIDPVLNRYTTYDASFNFYQKQNYFSAPIPHDTIRIYLPVGFDFTDKGFAGLHLKVYSLNYTNSKNIQVSSYFFDDQDTSRQTEISLGSSFLYDEKQWGKYIQYDIPSPYYISKQRISNSTQNYPEPYTINTNLDPLGMNDNSPIFFDFSFIISSSIIFGVKYYKLGDLYRTSIAKIPEYQNLAVNISESTNGDYFEIYGTYGSSNENLDDFIEELNAKGMQAKLEYTVSLYEENILQRSQTYTVSENFAQKIYYRPIIMFSNTTAAIAVEMKVIDLVNMSSFSRLASLGLTQNLFKYGKNLSRIELSNAYKPKLYNTKPSTVTMQGGLNSSAVIDVTKVNYPLLIDKFKVLVGPNNSSASDSQSQITADITEYKSTGLLQIILTPFDNIIKFQIAKEITKDNVIEPLNLADLLLNAELTIIFKSDDQFIERSLFNETGENDLSKGIVVFKITESDVITIKEIQKSNNNFFLTIKAKNTNVRTQLYSGKFLLFENLSFKDTGKKYTTPTVNITENLSMTPTINEGTLTTSIETDSKNLDVMYDPNSYKNIMVFLKISSNPTTFENYIQTLGLKNNIYIKYNYSYFILAVPQAIITEIEKSTLVEKVLHMPFDLGKNKLPSLSPRERRIYEIENEIRNSTTWLASIQASAEENNTSLQEAIHLAATYQYELEQSKQSTKRNTSSNVNTLNEKLNAAINKINELEDELRLTKSKTVSESNTNINTQTNIYVKTNRTIVARVSYSTSAKYIGGKIAKDTIFEVIKTHRIGTAESALLGTSEDIKIWYQINTKEHDVEKGTTVLGWIPDIYVNVIEN